MIKNEKRVVILGAGFAGISAKLYYPKSILIDSSDKFFLTPRSIDLIEGKETISSVLIPRKVDVLAEVRSIDFRNKRVITSAGDIKYDKLIISLGFSQDLVKIRGAEKYALKYESIYDVLNLKERLKSSKRVVIIGGGALGVELAGVIGKSREKEVYIIEAESRLLPVFNEELSRKYF